MCIQALVLPGGGGDNSGVFTAEALFSFGSYLLWIGVLSVRGCVYVCGACVYTVLAPWG